MIENVRDHLSNERTFLAWVRTSLAMIGLGFVLARMGLFLRQLALTTAAMEAPTTRLGPNHPLHGGHEFMVSGVVFLAIGTVLGALAYWHYERNRRAIDTGRYEPSGAMVLTLTGVVVVGSLVIIGLVLWHLVAE